MYIKYQVLVCSMGLSTPKIRLSVCEKVVWFIMSMCARWLHFCTIYQVVTGTVDTVDFSALINSIFFALLDRASISHYNNNKIIKFGWELFILWDISYGLSFSWFARFPEFARHDDQLMANPKNTSISFKIKVFNDDLRVIIMRKRCSIQQGEKNNCSSEQSPKNWLLSRVKN